MHNRFYLSLIIFLIFIIPLHSQVIHRLDVDRFTHYRIDDWISYAPALHITSIDIGPDFIYFGSLGGGVLRYDKYANEWHFPHTTSNGLRSNKIKRIVYNADNNFLYARTPKGIDVYKPAEDFWQPAYIDRMPRNNRPKADDSYDPSAASRRALQF